MTTRPHKPNKPKRHSNVVELHAHRASVGPGAASAVMNIIVGVSEMVRGYEATWGINRLPLLVSDATRLRFREANQLWGQAVETYQHQDVEKMGRLMHRAWKAMHDEAVAAVASRMASEGLEAMLPGGVALIVASGPEAAHFASEQAKKEGRQVVVISMEEVARLYQQQADAATRVLTAFPGALVTRRVPDGFAGDWARARQEDEPFLASLYAGDDEMLEE